MTGELSDVSQNFISNKLKSITTIEREDNIGAFPDIQEDFSYVAESFNRQEATTQGKRRRRRRRRGRPGKGVY
jgi:hypothetical protein